MINQQLLDFIKQQRLQGVSDAQIKTSLLANGWNEQDLYEAFSIGTNPVPTPPVQPTPPVMTPQTQPVQQPSSQPLTQPQPQVFQPVVTSQTANSNPPIKKTKVLLGEAWAIYKSKFLTFISILIIPVIISTLLAVLFISLPIVLTMGISLFVVIPVAIVAGLIFIVSLTWSQLALMHCIHYGGGFSASYGQASKKILSSWWISILTVAIVMGGLLLFIVPGIILGISLSFSLFILVAEDLKGMRAILKSREYVKGRMLKVFKKLATAAGITIILSSIPSSILGYLLGTLGEQIWSAVTMLFVTPFVTTFMFMFYLNLKESKGEFVFEPTKKRRVGYILLGIFGLLIIPAITFTLSSLNQAREVGVDALRKNDIVTTRTYLEIYYDQNYSYPESLENLVEVGIISSVPSDPTSGIPYSYTRTSTNSYRLCADYTNKTIEPCFEMDISSF